MKQKVAYKSYLEKHFSKKTVGNYITHCNSTERIFGMDMNDIIAAYDIDRIKAEQIKHGYKGYASGVQNYIKFVDCGWVVRTSKPVTKRPVSTKINVSKGEELSPYKLVWYGEDPESDNIKYADNVLPEQQVPQLCGRLESEYNRIIEFARHILGDCFSDCFPERIRVELRKECPSRIYFNNDKYVTKKINELIKKREIVTEKEISKILRFEDRIAGLFIDKTPHIVIYFNQFYADTWDEYIAKIAKTLAHEYAHYLEYAYCKVNDSKSYQDACVSEAIADFFGVLYSVYSKGVYNLQVAKERYNKWIERFGSGWPYAYALYFYKVDGSEKDFLDDFDEYGKSIQKLIRVFKATPNGSDAFNKLIN